MDTHIKKEVDPALINIVAGEQLGLGYGAIHTEIQTKEEVEKRAEIMRSFFVEVDPSLPSDCIDGRHSLRLLDGTKPEAARAGVAGGAGVTGYAAAELTGYFGESSAKPAERFKAIVERLESEEDGKKAVKVGGHVDADAVDRNFIDGKTGCGAADKFIGNLALLGSDRLTLIDLEGKEHIETDVEAASRVAAVRGLTAAVVGESGYYDDEQLETVINDIVQTATFLTQQAKLEGWSGAVMREELAARGGDRLVVLDTSAGGVHGHTERKVLFNFIDSVTFDQDAYFDATEQNEGVGREVFDVDVWHIKDIAEALADSPDETQASRLFAAGVAFQIATYLGLCDGSHRPFFAKAV